MRSAEGATTEGDQPLVLITGARGLVGRALVRTLRALGARVLAASRNPTPVSIPGVTSVHLDVRDRAGVLETVARCDAAVHLAALVGNDACVANPVEAVEINVRGTLHVLEAARASRKPVVHASVPNVDDLGPYAVTKSTAERFAAMYAKEHGVRVHTLRLFNAYGPGQDETSGKLVARNVARGLRGEPLICHGGEQVEDFIHVDDAARVFALAAMEMLTGDAVPAEPSDVGTGVGTSIRDVLALIAELTGNRSEVRVEPPRVGQRCASLVARSPIFTAPQGFVTLRQGIGSLVGATERPS